MSQHDRPKFAGISLSAAGIGAVIRQRPEKYNMLMSFAEEILREPSHLSAAQREVLAAYTSSLNGCEYCRGSHAAFAASLGASDSDLEAASGGEIRGHPMEALLEYVKKLTVAPSDITEADKQAVHAAGFSEEQLKDAIAVCAAFNLFNRLVEGHGIGPRDDYSADTKMINAHGYDRRR